MADDLGLRCSSLIKMMSERKDDTHSPPPERGRSAREASRVGVSTPWRFNKSAMKTARARNLRRDSNVEMKLWQKLRNRQLGVDFRRQHPAGIFVLDFYAPSIGLAVELDGGQHADSDVSKNFSGVLEVIAAKVDELQRAGAAPVRRWSGEAKSS